MEKTVITSLNEITSNERSQRISDLRPRLHTLAIACLAVSTFAAPSHAEEKPLSGAEIRSWLENSTAFSISEETKWVQFFSASGDTPYQAIGSKPSLGSWSVRGNEYCSRWPPNSEWTCYTMTGEERDGVRHVTWISQGGFMSAATLKPGNHGPAI